MNRKQSWSIAASALAIVFAAGFYSGRLSTPKPNSTAPARMDSRPADEFTVQSSEGNRLVTPILGTDSIAFDFAVATSQPSQLDQQVFSFYMGFTR
ncbi:MAG: hypothetical protein U0930_14695 [Pirellulales bacterium]